jgi:hypothetical protein
MRKKHIPFVHLPRRKRRDLYVRLRWHIRNTAAIYGGLFTSHQVLDEPGESAIYNQWADVLFCGSDGLTIWNAEIITSTTDFWDKAENLAFTRAWEKLTPEEQEHVAKIETKPVWHGRMKCYETVDREKVRYEKFGGLTFYEYQDSLADEIIRSDPLNIYESFVTDKSYRYGIGLYIVTHADIINPKTIEQAIKRFREVGETDWQADRPVPRNELPMESQHKAYSRISASVIEAVAKPH